MRIFTLFVPAVIVLGACASASGGPASSEVRTGTVGMDQTSSMSVVNAVIPRPIDEVWRALPGAYASLGLPLTTLEVKTHTAGNEGIKLTRQLGGTALSHYIECGTTQIGPNADSYDVVLTMVTQLQPGESGATKLTTTFQASAKPITYSQDYSRCSSKGLLEASLTDSVTKRVMRR